MYKIKVSRKTKSKVKRALTIVLIFCLSLGLSVPKAYAGNTSSGTLTNDSIREKQEQIKESEALKKKLQSSISDSKKLKKELEGLKADVAAYISKLDEQIEELNNHIEELNTLIAEKEVEIEVATEDLRIAIETEEKQYQAMKDQIKFMYEQGDSFYLEIMLDAKSFSDFLTKASYVDQLEAYEKKCLEEYRATREWTELCKANLEADKEALDEAKVTAESEEETLEVMLAEKETELANYNKQISQAQADINSAEAAYAAEVSAIEALEAAILEEKKALAAAANKVTYDGGVFAWPCPQYIRITEEFGWRSNPFSGKSEFHSGLDMGAPAGSPILAAYDGVVVAATYNWSMGNYVMIDHGDGLFTIYMHASKLYVSPGTVVVRGEKIAAVGTTGSSTGNHLHFTVRLNGTYVSPWNYLG
ncbi:MAG: peptidoglycan DD-metalloendopeptidase family protein [Lachnospiraceae bacterium]|nr:peptidoglycan DD-metalloendopeptidase family protein [Lachnospiraceae bacterium]